jgi:hypothetical protein
MTLLYKLCFNVYLEYFVLLTNEVNILLLKLVKQCVGYFPYVNLHATVSPITRTVLKVRASAYCYFEINLSFM